MNAEQEQVKPRADRTGEPADRRPVPGADLAGHAAGRMALRVERPRNAGGRRPDAEVLRFRTSERMLHWAIAVPFMVCWVTALVLVLVYNPDPLRPFRDFFSWTHRISGVCLVVLPFLAMVKNRQDYRIHLDNMKCAVLWSLNDVKWILLMGLAAVTKKVKLPEQGKFNAAEKVNFMSVTFGTPLFVLTGAMIWMHEYGWVAWLIHACFALMVTPTMLGHIYMATVNPDTRTGLSGMISGYVDRQWAKHHYAVWYREHFEKKAQIEKVLPEEVLDRRIHVHCPACTRNLSVSWAWLLQKIFSVSELLCPSCGATFAAIAAVTDEHQLQWIALEFEKKAVEAQSRADSL